MPSALPMDDFKLEMEETEGFLISPSIATPPRHKSENSTFRHRWACFLLLVVIVLSIVLARDSESLRSWEGKGGEKVFHMVHKGSEPTINLSSSPSATPTPSPVEQSPAPLKPTPSPEKLTLQPSIVVLETAPPTDAAIQTPPPTDAVIETPPPAEDLVETAAPTDAIMETPPPTEAIVETAAPTEAVLETPPPTEAIVETPPPTDALMETPAPTEDAVETAAPTQAILETPPPTEAIVETAAPTEAILETPPPTEAIVETAAPTDTIVVTPAPTDAQIAEGIPDAVPKEDINADIDFGPSHYPKPTQVVKPDPPLTIERAKALAQDWGMWEFVDPNPEGRPKTDYCGEFPNRDIPRDKFPENAWQTDKEYLKVWLDQAVKLVHRAQESILSEYGHGTKDQPVKSFEERAKEMFNWLKLEPGVSPGVKNMIQEAGWTTEKSFQGLVRRVLHAIVTRDTFTFVLGGHSAAAGHGNHFKQSYAMQFHKVMEPVFGLLGVNLNTYNVAQGGVGTLQHSLGFRDLYGDNIDFMVWDSGMTEGRGSESAHDMFWRQALISGDRVPFLVGSGYYDPLLYYNEHADADVGNFGEAMGGLPVCTDELQCDTFPWAVRYINCGGDDARRLCDSKKWRSNCWVERKDVTPTEKQDAAPGSQVSWHPGFRKHQLVGRNLAFLVLRALKEALTIWKDSDEYVLSDDVWHVTDYYANIRGKVKGKEGETNCYKSEDWPKRMCSLPMRAYTEFQPRPNPEKTSLVSILKPASNGFKPHIHPGNLYNGPDVFNPFTAIPDGEVDVLAIVSNGRTYEDNRSVRRLASEDPIEPGLGDDFVNKPRAGYCDATYNMECGRQGSCLLSGHGDSRACLGLHSYSGWIVMTLPNVKEGIIVTKIETWHSLSDLPVSSTWTSINNQGRRHLRGLIGSDLDGAALLADSFHPEDLPRHMKADPPEFCDNFRFEFAIDGKITSWDKDTFMANNKNAQRVVELQTLMDDPNFTSEPKDVEFAVRMTGCGDSTKKTFCLTHVYFA